MYQNSRNIFNLDNIISEHIEKENEESENHKLFNMERIQKKLTLRKKKINEKICNIRKIQLEKDESLKINTDKFIYLNEPFTIYISKLSENYLDENKLIDLLNKISYIFEQKYKQETSSCQQQNTIYRFTINDLIINNFIDKINNLILKYLKSKKVILYLSRILLFSSLFIGNKLELEEDDSGYFISNDKYIDIYNKILEIYINDDSKIPYNMIVFIGNILKETNYNQKSLFSSGTLNYIIDSIDVEKDSKNILEEKIWCLSQFKQDEIYKVDWKFSLKVQNIYYNIFLKKEKFNLFDDVNKKADENNFLFNYLKLIKNTSNCLEEIFIQNLVKSNILQYLFNNFINFNKDNNFLYVIIDTLINLSFAEFNLSKQIINIGAIEYLLKIISNKNYPISMRIGSFIPINNYINDMQLWKIILYEKKVLEFYYILLNDQDIESYIFSEICLSFFQLLYYGYPDNLKEIINSNLIEILCKDMKDILKRNISEKSIYDCLTNFLSIIIQCLKMEEEETELIDNICYIFKLYGGEEIIDKIIGIYSNTNLENRNNEDKENINNLLEMSEKIKNNIKNI